MGPGLDPDSGSAKRVIMHASGEGTLKRRSRYQDPGDTRNSTSGKIPLQRKTSQESGRQTSERGR